MFKISSVGSGSWSFWSYFRNYYVRLDVKWSATHCKGSQKITLCATIKEKLSLKGSQFCWKSYSKSFIPMGLNPIIHLMMSIGSKLVFNHVPRSSCLHICTSFSFTLPRERLIPSLDSSYKGRYHIISYPYGWMLKNTYKSSPKLYVLETISDLRPILRRTVLMDHGVNNVLGRSSHMQPALQFAYKITVYSNKIFPDPYGVGVR